MIAVINIGMGNPVSIQNMLKKAGYDSFLCNSKDDLTLASGVILPGVGAFDAAVTRLNESGMKEELERMVLGEQRVNFLGICLGMQLLFRSSEEGNLRGLGWLEGRVAKLIIPKEENRLKIPHMGWNVVKPVVADSLIPTDKEQRFYFVHSYCAADVIEDNILAKTNYGGDFVCAVQKHNIFGVQFHPEKSHLFGIALLRRFAEKCHA